MRILSYRTNRVIAQVVTVIGGLAMIPQTSGLLGGFLDYQIYQWITVKTVVGALLLYVGIMFATQDV